MQFKVNPYRVNPSNLAFMYIRLILLVAVLSTVVAKGQQLNQMEIGIDGLTCSLCSRNVEMSLRKLDFVQTVYMDLEKTQGRIYLKPELDPQPDKIAQAVRNAGYSVRFLTAGFAFPLPVQRKNVFQ
jgi:copper chaperone CopZ